MIDPLVLRASIKIILESQIGTYQFRGGMTEAIAILPDPQLGWQYPEQGTKVTGLEVVIKQPVPEVQSNIGGDRTKEYAWSIHLKQWDTTKSLRQAVDLLIDNLPGEYFIERVSMMPASDKLLTVEQCKIFLKEWTTNAAI
ncbi:hypothetical protein [Iningainema tapete]|uniref:Uncharacterized protein n=1 Tax=Iningainema tapete BLCC-T55 TaxID=2748662 RepID=A0A8J7BWL4_9CYAN|nr:hypothetical protein [Iningainema tapete]MBD2771138.1 hypothetical protein [Iningainema tapete BLCC-T55]